MKKIMLVLVSFGLVGCFGSAGENTGEKPEAVSCSLTDWAKLYTVKYTYESGNCGELQPAYSFTTLLPVADCSIVDGSLSDDACSYSFVEECREGSKVHRAEFSQVKRADGIAGTVKFSGWPCEGEYSTVLILDK